MLEPQRIYDGEPVREEGINTGEDGLPVAVIHSLDTAETLWAGLQSREGLTALGKWAVCARISAHAEYGDEDLRKFSQRPSVREAYGTLRWFVAAYRRMQGLEIARRRAICEGLMNGLLPPSFFMEAVAIESNWRLAALMVAVMEREGPIGSRHGKMKYREVRKKARAIKEHQRHKALEATKDSLEAIEGKYGLIYADPPWQYDFAETDSRKIENHYPTMTVEEIEGLGESVPASDDALLFLWATSPKLREALRVVAAWGFEYVTCMVWVKPSIITGYYARQQHELLLIGKRGDPPVPQAENRPPSVMHGPRTEHSRKPQAAYEVIERMYPERAKLELFARNGRPGWKPWGNEVA